tara:strand:+ start:4267 stop:5520 length:1254 start_codon:yes stop_codon:yes gene_type:complete
MLDGQPKYDSYKDSGEIWLGNIPTDWNLESIRAVTELKSKRGEPDLPVLSVYRDYGVILKDSRDDNHNATSLDTSNYKVVEPGDLVVNKMKAWQGSMGVSEHNGIVSPAYITCSTDPDKIVPRFLHYTLRSQPFIAVYNSLSYGVRIGQWDMHYEDFKKIALAYPDLDTQNRIVRFLDEKTAEIDAAITKKRRLIELLNEQKAILINRAVTKGLNPDAPMKDSGVDWIGEIPAHWDVTKVKSVFDLLDNRRIPLSGDVRGQMTERTYDYYGASGAIDKVDDYIFDETTILIAEDGANLVMRNLPLAIIATGKYWVNNHAHILRPRDGDVYYWANALEAADYRTLISGAAQPKLTKDAIKNVFLPRPPTNEQADISKRLEAIPSQFEPLENAVAQEISTLNEFKQTLIANAVTGKIKI